MIVGTRDRLLNEAERLFSLKGFDGASIRDLTTAAGSNIAAVNYHFGSKLDLYHAVVRRRLESLAARRIAALRSAEESTDEPKLERLVDAFSRSFIEPLLTECGRCGVIELLMREMLDGRLPGDFVWTHSIEPTTRAAADSFVRAVPGLQTVDAKRATVSLAGQLLHLVHHRHLGLPEHDQTFDLESMLRHIVAFSCAGIRGLAANPVRTGLDSKELAGNPT